MKKVKGLLFLLLCFFLALTVSACSNDVAEEDNDDSGVSQEDSNGSSNDSSNDSGDTGETTENIDPLGKYEEPIVVEMTRNVDGSYEFKDGEDIGNNVWTRRLEEDLGVKMEYPWTASGEQYETRMNLSAASGDLADMFEVPKVQLPQLVEAGAITDLTEVYEKYASPFLKEIMNNDGGAALGTGTFDGKLYALPGIGSLSDSLKVIWIRHDWLDNLGLEPPETMDDLLEVSRAFTEDDPDQNGKDDTFGLAVEQNLYVNTGDVKAFFNGYHAYPDSWVEDDSGNLAYGSIQPEMKEGLAQLRDMFAAGQLDPEFGVKDANAIAEDLGSGRHGMLYGAQWNAIYPLDASSINDGAKWFAHPIVSVDDEPALVGTQVQASTHYAVNADFEHPEVLIKLANYYVENLYGETAMEQDFNELQYWIQNEGTEDERTVEIFKYSPVNIALPTKNIDNWKAVNKALEEGGVYDGMTPENRIKYQEVTGYLDGNINMAGPYGVFGPDGSQKILNYYMENELYTINKFTGAVTPTMSSKQSTLDTMEIEAFTKIIMGDEPLDHFDEFVKNWLELGGSDITDEVNDWYQGQ